MANVFSADFLGWRSVADLRGITVMQKFGNHTLFFLDYHMSRNQNLLLPPKDTPFTVRMGSTPLGVRTFYGYVNHLEESVDSSGRAVTRLVGLGTSKVMNSMSMMTREGQSRTGIAQAIATSHRLRSVVHHHPEVLDMWHAGDKTDFQALNDLADAMGYLAWVDGATMWLLDPVRVLATASTLSTKTVGKGQQKESRVFKGSGIPGQVSPDRRIVRYDISPSSPEVLTSTAGDRGQPVEVLSRPSGAFGAADYATEAMLRKRKERVSTEALLEGDATLSPGSPLRFLSDVASPDQIGLWMVNSATHEISASGFTTRVTATRDHDRPLRSNVPDVVRREGTLAEAVARNGRTWEAKVQERIDA